MFNTLDYDGWCERLGLKSSTRALLDRIRSSQPERPVQSSGYNVSGRFPSRKMGRTIQFESHKVELVGIHQMEHDPNILEYYDQPCTIKLTYQSKAGRSIGVQHTPDFMVFRRTSAGWEEWKTEEHLEQLAKDMPHRYVKGEDGQWLCPPGEEYASQFGLYYRVRSDKEIDWVLYRNLIFLDDYYRRQYCDDDAAEYEEGLCDMVAQNPGISLSDLLSRPETPSADFIYSLIVADRLYVNLSAWALAEPDRCKVYLTQAAAAADDAMVASRTKKQLSMPSPVRLQVGCSLQWNGRRWTIINVGFSEITLLDESGTTVSLPSAAFEDLVKSGKVGGLPVDPAQEGKSRSAQQRLFAASPKELQEANQRYRAVEPILLGQSLANTQVPKRTLRRWIARYRTAQQVYGYGFLGLLPSYSTRGNRGPKMNSVALRITEELIETQYETFTNKRIPVVYGDVRRVCEAQGVDAPSMKTFRKAIKRRNQYQQLLDREGPRAAYEQEPQYLELKMTTPRHGDRPFEVCHIDHTELDIECVSSRTGKPLGRPWATFLVDAFSRRLLAVYLSFDPPSYRSCMMILRICVQRHGRLPQTIVTDGGKEFGSLYYQAFTAMYEIITKTRPPAKARFGSVLERLFGTTNTRFVHNLLGNTQVMRNVRQVTKSVNPRNHATWDLPGLYERLCEWAYEVYDTIEHPALHQTPREAFSAGLAQAGNRSQVFIPYDETFRMLTLPSTKQGTAKVQPARGIKIGYLYYTPVSSTVFRDPDVENQQVHVRYDPFDIGVAYAWVKGTWIRCVSEYFKVFCGRSEKEIKLASAELRKSLQVHGSNSSLTAKKIADFLESVEAEQALRQQRLRDSDAREVLTVLDGGKASTQSAGTVVQIRDKQKAPPQPSAVLMVPSDLQPYGELE